MSEMRALPRGFLSSTYRITADGGERCVLKLSFLRSKGEFELDTGTYTVESERRIRPHFALRHAGVTLCRVAAKGFRTLSVEGLDRMLDLKMTGRRFKLMHGETQVGSIRRERLFGRTVVAELPEIYEEPVRVFLLAVALLTWRRHRRNRG